MKLIGAAGLDLAALPIGDNYTMGPADALEAVRLLKPRRVVPIHNGTRPFIAQDAAAWARQVRAGTGVEAVLLQPGGNIFLVLPVLCAEPCFGVRRFIAALQPLAAFKGRKAAESGDESSHSKAVAFSGLCT